MSASTTLPDEQLLAAWRGVLGAAGTQTIDKMAYGAVWSIATASGARFVLKRVADALAERVRRFTEEARIVIHLGQRGVLVAVPILSDDGRICVQHDGALWALTPMLPVPDNTALPTADSLVQEKAGYHLAVGRAIAELHVALADCPYDIDRGIIGPDQFAQRWDSLRAELPEATFAALRRRVDPRREQIATALACVNPQRLHGDCHGGNILFRDGRVTGIVDIDHLQVGPRVYDLAYHLAFHLHWVVRTDVPVGPAVASMSSATRHLINGYQAVSLLSEEERAAIAAIALDAALSMVAFWKSIGNATETDVWVRTACWIADHEETFYPNASGAAL